jgi:hypothetical protein
VAVAPVEAQSIRQSISRAAVDAAAAAQNRRGGIAPAYLWTGVGLLGGAALFATSAAVLAGEDCTTTSGANFTQTICLDYDSSTIWALAGATAAAGAVVLILGAKKGRSAPSLTFTPGGVAVRQTIPLGRRDAK